MASSEIRQQATITKVFKGRIYEAVLTDNPEHKAIVTISGKMRIRRIALIVGDSVDIELSPYDLKRGRVVWRHQV